MSGAVRSLDVSIFGEFRVPAQDLVLGEALDDLPEAVIEIDRVVASREVLTPYFWVSGVPPSTFEAAVADDTSLQNLRALDEFDGNGTTLYRADWPNPVESLVYAYTDAGAIILEAVGQDGEWELRIRFDDEDALESFQAHCREAGVEFAVERLYRTEQPRTGGQFGLTKKQQAALVTAWEAGYFEFPRKATLAEIAADLDITQQSLSDRIRRGFGALVANTLVVTSPEDLGGER